jgi:hypothetical protein
MLFVADDGEGGKTPLTSPDMLFCATSHQTAVKNMFVCKSFPMQWLL